MGKPQGCLRHGFHAFVPAEPLCEGCPDPEHGDDPCGAEGCPCRHPVPCPEVHEHDWSEWGTVYHGGHLRWRKCFGCIAVESTPEGHFCPDCAPVCDSPKGCYMPNSCLDSCAFGDQLRGIRMMPRPEPFVCAAPAERCPDPDSCLHGCQAAADELTRLGQEMEPEAQPLCPSYAVAYATGSGALIELALPGDASAAVVNGALVICHPSGVLGIQHVKPCGEAE